MMVVMIGDACDGGDGNEGGDCNGGSLQICSFPSCCCTSK